MGSLEDRIAAAEGRLRALKVAQQKVEARRRSLEVKRRRQEETRRKVLAGAVLLARVECGEWPEADFRAMMDKALTRPEDRGLFGLGARGESGDEENTPGGEIVEGELGGEVEVGGGLGGKKIGSGYVDGTV